MKKRTPDNYIAHHPDDGYTIARRAPGTACWVYMERGDKRSLKLLLIRERVARLAGRLFRRTNHEC